MGNYCLCMQNLDLSDAGSSKIAKWHGTLTYLDVKNSIIKETHWKRRESKRVTHRFGDKANRSRSVQLALKDIVNCSSSITNLKSSSLDTSNSSWANNNLKKDVAIIRYLSLDIDANSDKFYLHLTLLFARAKAINCFVSDSGTPSAIIATTLIVGCLRADIDEAAAL